MCLRSRDSIRRACASGIYSDTGPDRRVSSRAGGYSSRLLPLIEWEPTEDGNVRVLNDTSDYYRYFDATPHAEFLYSCVKRTIEEDLPRETDYLRRYDEFRRSVEGIVDMPANTNDLLFQFLRQNGGKLSKRACEKEFAKLNESEVARIEEVYKRVF
jgi:hypothetical protein